MLVTVLNSVMMLIGIGLKSIAALARVGRRTVLGIQTPEHSWVA